MEPQFGSTLPGLTGDSRRFWEDAAFRREALSSILEAFDAGDRPRARTHLATVDRHVTAGMSALGYPRRDVTDLSVESLPGVAGVKMPNCHLKFGVEELTEVLARSPDEAIITWLHESVHGRHGPWSVSSLAAWRYVGYEEGLAEGLAQIIGRSAGLVVPAPLYPHYVRCYELLADRLRV